MQEDAVYQYLLSIFGEKVKRQVSYNEMRGSADFYIEGVGYVEYDGSGYYHFFKKSDKEKDIKYSPIRLSSQAYFGGVPYIKNIILGEKEGYCAVVTPKEYSVSLVTKRRESSDMLNNCHPLANSSGTFVFGLFYGDMLIGVAKFGHPTDRGESGLELRRFFVLDGTPRNTESWFLRKCEKELPNNTKIITYTHRHEKGSYLKALGYTEIDREILNYDSYLIGNRLISKRVMFGIAKRLGMIDKFGTKISKELLNTLLGGEKIIEPSKRKFIKVL
jgi:hypothetical protein